METTARTITWSGVGAAGVNSSNTCQIAANQQAVVQLYSNSGQLSSVVGVPQPDDTIRWGAPQTKFDHGDSTASAATIALSNTGIALSFHVTSAVASWVFWGDVGMLDVSTASIRWKGIGDEAIDDEGHEPTVAINDDGTFVLIHRTDNVLNPSELYYRVGKVDAGSTPPTVTWGPKQPSFWNGFMPSIALSGNTIVCVCQSGETQSELRLRVGTVDFSAGTINWGAQSTYNDSGLVPHISLLPSNDLVEVHATSSSDSLTAPYLATHLGTCDPALSRGTLEPQVILGYGHTPSIAALPDSRLVYSCIDADNDGSQVVNYATGTLAAVTYGLPPNLLNQPYNRITFPGTHNAYSNPYDGDGGLTKPGFPPPNRNNSLSITDQLDLGIRCLGIEVHTAQPPDPNYDRVLVYHGPNIAAAESTCYCYLNHLCATIAAWVQDHPAEIVTVYIDPQDQDFGVENVQANFRDGGLDPYVFAYVASAPEAGWWPTLQEMLNQNKPVMVVMPGVGGPNNLMAQNSFRNGSTVDWTWDAKVVADLSPGVLVTPVNPNRYPLFRDSSFCSRRSARDTWYLTGGNPYQAARANQYPVVHALAQAIDADLAAQNLVLNYIWCEFANTNAYGVLQAAYDLNAARTAVAPVVEAV